MVPRRRIELRTQGFSVLCSTNWATSADLRERQRWSELALIWNKRWINIPHEICRSKVRSPFCVESLRKFLLALCHEVDWLNFCSRAFKCSSNWRSLFQIALPSERPPVRLLGWRRRLYANHRRFASQESPWSVAARQVADPIAESSKCPQLLPPLTHRG